MSFIVKNTTKVGLLDLIAPHTCRGCGALGEALCECCKNNITMDHENYCPFCKTPSPTGICPTCKNHGLPPIFAIDRRDTLIGTLIHDFKYNSTRALGKKIAELSDEILPVVDGKVAIVPLPTIGRHIRERGLDHTLFIANRLAHLRGHRYHVSRLLTRAKNTVQVGTDRTTRIVQASTAYELSDKATIDPTTTYILIDDVWTTGASMKAALKKLQQAGASKIIIFVLAIS